MFHNRRWSPLRPVVVSINQTALLVPGANTIPGITISKDGKYLYVVNEGATEGNYPEGSPYQNNPYHNPTWLSNSDLSSELCVNKFGEAMVKNEKNGVLTVIDVDKAKRGWGQRSIIQTIAAGCSPVRVVETTNGKYIFVATRGGNPGPVDSDIEPRPGSVGRILVFDAEKLRSSKLETVNDALVNVIEDSGGTQPVGMALFDNDRLLALANSNRFTNGVTGITSVAILDVSNLKAPKIIKVIPNNDKGSFPRSVTLGPDGSTLYVPNFNASMLEVIRTSVTND
jgi:hypothetical protein